jgi:hypothetical protein
VLAQSGQSLTTVQAAIAGSPEAAADLNGIYENALGRPVDPGGLAAWQAVLAQSGQSLATVQAAIAGSPEAAADLTTVYQDVLGRAADAGGLAGWQAILAQPGQSLATVRADIAESPESQGNLQFLYQAFTGQSPSTADINSATLQLNTTTLGAQFLNLYEQDYGGAIQTATPNTPLAVQPGHDLIGINFSGSNGLYTVSGFNPALDFVQINDAATAAPTAVSQVYNSANGVRIDFSNSSELLLQGVTSSQIHVSNFLIS